MESDELFDYISDLPNDNVLEICNFVLIGGGGEAGVGCGEAGAGAGCQEELSRGLAGAGDSYDMNTSYQEHNFVEVMDFRSEDNNNNHSEEQGDKIKVRFVHLRILLIVYIQCLQDCHVENSPTIATSIQTVVKAKRGRPPSKPPSKEVLKSRRRVS